ncbi:MAG: hypothetical protein ACRCY7_00075 [Cetobacterium sp.]|uniref:hypothetical protein n=1 Tax=Cetobacterium sp. TaxID=2071632 RepID=UPI003F2BACEE
MEIKELQEKVNILANRFLELESKEIKIKEHLKTASDIVQRLEKIDRAYKTTRLFNKIFCFFLILLLGVFVWLGSILLNYQKQIDDLKKYNNKIIEVLQKERKFWVDNEKNIYWDKIENISEEIKNPKPTNKKKGK